MSAPQFDDDSLARRAPYMAALADPARLAAALDAAAPRQTDLDVLVFTAANRAHFASAHVLLERGASANATVTRIPLLPMLLRALCAAPFVLEGEQKALCEELVARGAPVDEEECTALYYCASFGHAESVRFLLAHGANVERGSNGCVNEGRSPLHGAASEARLAVVRMLLQAGANPMRDVNGETVLHAAIGGANWSTAQQMDRTEVVRLLLRHGVDTSARWCTERVALRRGATPLQLAKKMKRADLVALF